MTASIFWYDFETTGASPRCDRPLQVAGVRTSETLEEIGEPLNLYCRLAEDQLPHPAACLITGIAPTLLEAQGLREAEFIDRLHRELAHPGTCVAGYNNLRFDDEVTRHALFRNFFDPYAREWQGGNSRWDIIDLVRAAYALRPEGLEWPCEEGRPTLRLERLSAANGLAHAQAHDALSDVRATIALARLVRQRQPKLYGYLYALRRKSEVLDRIRLLQPLLHVSGRFSAERHFLSVVLPLAWHPRNRNAVIVCDLMADPAPLLNEEAPTLRQRLYTRHAALAENELPVPLKLVHVNRCPVVAPLSVLRDADIARTGLDLSRCRTHAQWLVQEQAQWSQKLEFIYRDEESVVSNDPEQQLYGGFLGERDRRLCEQVRTSSAAALATGSWPFEDKRLPDILFRYRARNFPESLSAAEQVHWKSFCRQRLLESSAGASITWPAFERSLEELLPTVDGKGAELLLGWRDYLRRRSAGLVSPDPES